MIIPLLLSGLAVFCTHAVAAVTGFGSAALALPFIISLLGMRRGIVVITILAWIIAVYYAVIKRREINFRQAGIIIGFMLPGMPLGMLLFRSFDTLILKKILAVFIIAISVWQLLQLLVLHHKNENPPGKIRALLYRLLLVTGGIVHGMFTAGGPLAVIYAAQSIHSKAQFRATLNFIWSVLNFIIIVTFIAEGSFNAEIAVNTAALIPFLAAGIIIGEIIHGRMNERVFSITVFSILLLTGCFMAFF